MPAFLTENNRTVVLQDGTALDTQEQVVQREPEGYQELSIDIDTDTGGPAARLPEAADRARAAPRGAAGGGPVMTTPMPHGDTVDVVAEGDLVRVRGPRNHFALVDSPRYLFLAGGIGSTPIVPMVAKADARGAEWRLVYGGRTRASMAFRRRSRGEVRTGASCGRRTSADCCPSTAARHAGARHGGVLLWAPGCRRWSVRPKEDPAAGAGRSRWSWRCPAGPYPY